MLRLTSAKVPPDHNYIVLHFVSSLAMIHTAKNSFGFPSVVHQTPSTSTVADGKTSAAIAATTASIQQQIQRRKKLVAHGKLGRQQNQKKALNSVHANAPVLHDSASAFGKKQEEMNCQQTTTANQV